MERLNEIINRTAQRRQGGLDKSSPYNTSLQGPRPRLHYLSRMRAWGNIVTRPGLNSSRV